MKQFDGSLLLSDRGGCNMENGGDDELNVLVLGAAGTPPSAEEIEAASKPPYPAPQCYAAFEKAAREALQSRLEQGGSGGYMAEEIGSFFFLRFGNMNHFSARRTLRSCLICMGKRSAQWPHKQAIEKHIRKSPQRCGGYRVLKAGKTVFRKHFGLCGTPIRIVRR
jgi:hypothetical protein